MWLTHNSHVFSCVVLGVLLASSVSLVKGQDEGRVDHVGIVTLSELRKEISSHPYVIAMLCVVESSPYL